MRKSELEVANASIASRIITIRGVQVILDRDLAKLYGVETKILNQAVKRNINRFPSRFMFQLGECDLKQRSWASLEIYALCLYRARCCNVVGNLAKPDSDRGKYSHYGRICGNATFHSHQCSRPGVTQPISITEE